MCNNDLNCLGLLIGLAGVGYALYTNYKMNKICNKIDTTIEDMDKDMSINIPDAIINKAVDRAVEKEVYVQVEEATTRAIKEIEVTMSTQIKSAIESEYSNIRKSVEDKLAKEVENIDIQALKKEVRDQAKLEVISRFNGNLDDLLEEFNGNLSNISKIYKSIADTMSGFKEKETVLRLS